MEDKYFEIRDPVHGFIKLNEWEWAIINHPVFQRLRRIRQLGLTDMVYPGAMHSRFEHSLGVMHVATRMFDHIVERRKDFLKTELKYNDGGLERDKMLVRLSALLHDIGHAVFSHAAEGLMDKDPASGKPYKHEHYSAAVILFLMKDVIENHPLRQNYDITAEKIANFLMGEPKLGRALLWRNLVTSQLDADRSDYLLRDSHHIGVAYGHFDLNRLISTLTVALDQEDNPVLAIEEGGEHAAEGLIIARYMMFTQVYYHKTRRSYDYHSVQAVKFLLAQHQEKTELANKNAFPPPTSEENIRDYLKWDDWRVFGLINEGKADEHGLILSERNHFRCVYQTPEIPSPDDFSLLEEIQTALGEKLGFVDLPELSWYKLDKTDIPILIRRGMRKEEITTLSMRSPVVKEIKSVKRIRIYVPFEKKDAAKRIVEKVSEPGK